jgi:hypothetical protein
VMLMKTISISKPLSMRNDMTKKRRRGRKTNLHGHELKVDRDLRSFHDAIDDGNCNQAFDDAMVLARDLPSSRNAELRQVVYRFRSQCVRKGT